jgi:hypothetical protein
MSVNEIILSKVEEKTRIVGLNFPEKINFAQKGLEIHRQDNGNICAFCGNGITMVFQKLRILRMKWRVVESP